MKRFDSPRFFTSTNERHIIVSKKFVELMTPEEIFDILLDYGFVTRLELCRFDYDDRNLVEFVQDLNIEDDFDTYNQADCEVYNH